jgi:hypothetical protein
MVILLLQIDGKGEVEDADADGLMVIPSLQKCHQKQSHQVNDMEVGGKAPCRKCWQEHCC